MSSSWRLPSPQRGRIANENVVDLSDGLVEIPETAFCSRLFSEERAIPRRQRIGARRRAPEVGDGEESNSLTPLGGRLWQLLVEVAKHGDAAITPSQIRRDELIGCARAI